MSDEGFREATATCSFCYLRHQRVLVSVGAAICERCIDRCYEQTLEWGAQRAREVMERRNAERRAAAVVDTGEQK